MSDPTETVPDGPIADSGSREWTQRFLIFGFFSVWAIVEIAWLPSVKRFSRVDDLMPANRFISF